MFEMFRETCGLRMFMGHPSLLRNSSKFLGKKSAACLRALSSLAAVLPQVVGEGAQRVVVGPVVDECALAPRGKQPRRRQAFEVMAERRRRNIKLALNLPGGGPLRVPLHDVAHDREAQRVPECPELLRMMFELGGVHVEFL